MRGETDQREESLTGRLTYFSEKTPDQLAVVSSSFQCNYRQLEKIVAAHANVLSEKDVTSSSVVGILAADNLSHFILSVSASSLGCTVFTVPSYEPEAIQKKITEKCNATHLLTRSDLLDLDAVLIRKDVSHSIQGNHVSRYIFSTSGTTGEPKLVLHFDSDIVAQAHRHINSSGERFACIAAMEHNFSKRHRLYCLAQGATNVFLDDGQDLVDQCLTLNVNVLHVSAFQVQQLLANPSSSNLSKVRLKLGGSHVSSALRRKIKENITPNFQAGYGTTETGAIGFTDPGESTEVESVGRPLPGVEVLISNNEGKTVGVRDKGEILVRAKGMFRGYVNMPEVTDARLRDGWFYTGDLGYVDEEGRIFLAGRSDDMFVFNSINIYPQDIESCLQAMPEVEEIAVVGRPSEVHGTIPVALLVAREGVKTDLVGFKKRARKVLGLRCPRQFVIVESLPRNKAGKVDRKFVKALSFQAGQVRTAIVETLVAYQVDSQINRSMLEKFEAGERELHLSHLNLDSIVVVALLVLFEIEFDTIITPQTFVKLRTLNRIVAYVLESSSGSISKGEEQLERVYVDLEIKPYLLRFFQRILSSSRSTSTLNKALDTLEHRLAPQSVSQLYSWFCTNQLVPEATSDTSYVAVRQWLEQLVRSASDSPENYGKGFSSKRVSPAVWHYSGAGCSREKTLVIFFSTRGTRKFVLPNSVLLSYIDDARYDVMIVAEPLAESYQQGIPLLGQSEISVVETLAQMKLIRDYANILTAGCSAGAHVAIMAAYRLNAKVCLSLGGRFHKERYPVKILRRFFLLWKAIRSSGDTLVILCYSDRISRDRIFAKLVAKMSGGLRFVLKISGQKFSHQIIDQVSDMKKLNDFMSATIFESPSQLCELGNREMRFPTGEVSKFID